MICSSILGSLVYYKNISEEDLINKYGLEKNEIKNVQNLIMKIISIKYFGEEISFERFLNTNEVILNVCLVDLLTYFFQNKQMFNNHFNNENEIFSLPELEKIANLIGKIITEREEGLIL